MRKHCLPPLGCTNGVVRLVGSSYTYQGRVKICAYNTWGTVCDIYFGSNDARVVCHRGLDVCVWCSGSKTGSLLKLKVFYDLFIS